MVLLDDKAPEMRRKPADGALGGALAGCHQPSGPQPNVGTDMTEIEKNRINRRKKELF
jgi:hypothetical protein